MKKILMAAAALQTSLGAYQEVVIEDENFSRVINYFADEDDEIMTDNCLAKELQLNCLVMSDKVIVKKAKKLPAQRNFSAEVTASEREDIFYILSTLAKTPLTSLATSKYKNSLKSAGDRIDHIHPLKFLAAIFTDEELKADVAAIRNRGWIWGKFYSGLEDSLKEESKNGNLKPDYIYEFSAQINLDSSTLLTLLQERRWKDFINTLIDSVPRKGHTDRYDM